MVGCVILNWNGWQDTLACLQSLTTQTAGPLWVIVVDNGSTNDSVDRIRAFTAEASGPVEFTLIENGVNAGFGKGSNVGMRAALQRGCEYIWLLNNDTVCPPDTLAKLLATAAAERDAGIVGTVLYYHHDPSKVQAWSGGRVSRWLGTAGHFHAPAVHGPGTYVTFASALMRSAMLQEVGLLYEGAFMYYEDSDFCLRMEKTRWKIAVARDTAVLHKESASTEGPRNPFMEKTIAVAGMRFLRRHSPMPALSIPAFIGIKLLNRLRLGAWAASRAVLQAIGEYRRDRG